MNFLFGLRGDWIKRTVLTSMMLGFVAPVVADIAVLREKGPWSGSIGSNIGLLAEPSPTIKVSMVSAAVNIHLRRGQSDQLLADCTAEFVLEDYAVKGSEPQEFLVGFPVTGLASKVVTVGNFSVEVDGEKPATVYRRAVSISKWENELQDAKVYGRLAEKYQMQQSQARQLGVKLINEKIYPSAYVWSQESAPGEATRVCVTYTATLRPQTIHYEKSYQRGSNDGEVIPFSDIQVDEWGEAYYFFDYILVSGATWDGPIGHETISISADPELGLSLNKIQAHLRSQVGYPPVPRDLEKVRAGVHNFDFAEEGSGPQWTVRGKPDNDILFVIPARELGRREVR